MILADVNSYLVVAITVSLAVCIAWSNGASSL